MEDHRDHSREVEIDDEPPVSWYSISMRGRMVLMGLAYFSLAILLFSVTCPGMIDALNQMHVGRMNEPVLNWTQTRDLASAAGQQDSQQNLGVEDGSMEDLERFSEVYSDANEICLFNNFNPYTQGWNVDYPYGGKEQFHIHHYDGLPLGYLFLNASDDWSAQNLYWIKMYTYDKYSPPVGMQLGLKCSDDNKLESEKGGGYRSWGFGEMGPRFESFSPESDDPLPGFWATTGHGDTANRRPIRDIDMTQWHNYTILWEPERATFLVDGVLVATIGAAHVDPVEVNCLLNNAFDRTDGPGGSGYSALEKGNLDLSTDESIAIDYLCVAGLGLWGREEGFEQLIGEMYG